RSMPIFWPTSKPVALVTGRFVEPAGMVSHGPVDTGMNSVVMAVATVPTPAIVRVSPSMSIFCASSKPVVLRTVMLVAPGFAGAAAAGEVNLQVAFTLAPGATGSAKVFEFPAGPEATAVQPVGRERVNLRPGTGAPVRFLKVTMASCEARGVNVVTREMATGC